MGVTCSPPGQVADKAMPGISYLNEDHKAAFANPIVKFQQADLARQREALAQSASRLTRRRRAEHAEKVLLEEKGFDYVFNLCGETRFGMDAGEYQKKCVDTAVACGKVAAGKVKKWVEVSTAQVYKSDKARAVHHLSLSSFSLCWASR